MNRFSEKVSFIWSVADLIRGPYRPNQYKDIMLPMTVLRRLDCVLLPTKDKVLEQQKKLSGGKVKNVDPILCRVTGVPFYNTSRYTFEKLKGDPNNIAANLTHYIKGFSTRAREIIEHFGFEEHIAKLDKADRLYLVVSKFCDIDLHPHAVSNIEMGYIFEELIRRFNEASNEEAGDHFTPRELNPDARLEVFGQDYNAQAYAICGSDMMIKGQDIEHIAFGDSFTDDRFPRHKFDYMLANPPFGVEWKPEADFITREHEEQGFGGRFGAGLPRINDGSLLFLMHMISKMKDPKEGGTRLGIVFNGSPLFTGAAGSGESEIRRWIIENDWLEAIVALPDQLFYNTGIYTYLWIVTNRKKPGRRGKIQLVDATKFFKKMRKSLGNKRNEVCDDQRDEITRIYGMMNDECGVLNEHVRIFDNQDLGYRRITVERPLRLNFAVDEARIARLKETTAFANLATSKKRKDTKAAQAEIEEGKKRQDEILLALKTLPSDKIWKNCEDFLSDLKAAFKHSSFIIPNSSLLKAMLMALAERDETADVCTDAKGNPEPDPELRDYENVPLKEDVDEYMKREVLPHVPDAWVDESKTKIGYEINFNRYFYKYTPPRPLEEIEADLKKIEKEIADMLAEVSR